MPCIGFNPPQPEGMPALLIDEAIMAPDVYPKVYKLVSGPNKNGILPCSFQSSLETLGFLLGQWNLLLCAVWCLLSLARCVLFAPFVSLSLPPPAPMAPAHCQPLLLSSSSRLLGVGARRCPVHICGAQAAAPPLLSLLQSPSFLPEASLLG